MKELCIEMKDFKTWGDTKLRDTRENERINMVLQTLGWYFDSMSKIKCSWLWIQPTGFRCHHSLLSMCCSWRDSIWLRELCASCLGQKHRIMWTKNIKVGRSFWIFWSSFISRYKKACKFLCLCLSNSHSRLLFSNFDVEHAHAKPLVKQAMNKPVSHVCTLLGKPWLGVTPSTQQNERQSKPKYTIQSYVRLSTSKYHVNLHNSLE